MATPPAVVDQTLAKHAAAIRGTGGAIRQLTQQVTLLQSMVADYQSRPRSVQEEIDAIEGRRIEGTLSGEVTFTTNDVNSRAAPIVGSRCWAAPRVCTWAAKPFPATSPSQPDQVGGILMTELDVRVPGQGGSNG